MLMNLEGSRMMVLKYQPTIRQFLHLVQQKELKFINKNRTLTNQTYKNPQETTHKTIGKLPKLKTSKLTHMISKSRSNKIKNLH